MRLRLEATEDELRDRAPALLASLGKALDAAAPEIAEALRKAIPENHPTELRHAALQEGLDDVRVIYRRTLDAMLTEIDAALEEHAGKD